MPSQNDQDRELIDSIDRLNQSIDRLSDETKDVAEASKEVKSRPRQAFEAQKTAATAANFALNRAARSGLLGTGRVSQAFGGRGPGMLAQLRPLVTVLSNLHPALKIAAVALTGLGALSAVKRRQGKTPPGEAQQAGLYGLSMVSLFRETLTESKSQTKLLSGIMRESRRTGDGIEIVYGRRRAALDPFNRDPAFFGSRRSALTIGNLAPSEGQTRRASILTDQQNRLQEAQDARRRVMSDIMSPFRIASTGYRATTETNIAKWLEHGQRYRFGSPLYAGAVGIANQFAPEEDPRTSGALGGQAQRRLFALQARGPGQVLGGVATGAAGSLAEYQLRVSLQQEGAQRERTARWQQEVLDTLKAMEERGLPVQDEIFRKEVEFGRKDGSV